jgi:flagellar L-ring protein precursor FlgH
MFSFSPLRPFVVGTLITLGAILIPPASAHAQSMYADARARQPGDVITVLLSESTSAQRESSYQNRSNSQMGGSAGVNSPSVTGTFGLDAEFNQEASNANETIQSDLLQGTLTVQVTEVNDVGNLVVEGERRLNVNGVTHFMSVTGTVRPFDVRSDNTLFSYQIANAHIEYRQTGLVRRYTSPGFVARVGAVAVLGAAIFFGAR